MTKIFYLSEIVNFAIEKEQQSYDLYQNLKERSKNQDIKDLFQILTEQELEHKAFFKQIAAIIPDEHSPNVKENDEYMEYVRQLIDESRSIKALPDADIEDINKVLDFAIAREKDSILFYSGLRNLLPEDNRSKINLIIGEEAKHVAIVLKIKEKFQNS